MHWLRRFIRAFGAMVPADTFDEVLGLLKAYRAGKAR
jgi:hypothetical protein